MTMAIYRGDDMNYEDFYNLWAEYEMYWDEQLVCG